VYEVLREKEDAMERIRREVAALRSLTPMLADKMDARLIIPAPPARREVRTETISQPGDALRTAAPLLADETDDVLAKMRVQLAEALENDAKMGRAKRISRQLRHIAGPLLGANLG